jgi:2EXR family
MPTPSPSPELSVSRRQASYELNVFYGAAEKRRLVKTNCRAIEVPVLLPLRPNRQIDASIASAFERAEGNASGEASQESQDQNSSLERQEQGEDGKGKHSKAKETVFLFFSLPVEIRLKIYAFLLPSRVHKIASQYPHNGVYYSSAAQALFTNQSLYQAAIHASASPRLTTYTLLSANSRRDFPSPSIHPQILRACRRTRAEAEPLLYGAPGVVFDFGSYWPDALAPFWADRSSIARAYVTHVALAWDVPTAAEAASPSPTMQQWTKTCAFFRDELPALRSADLSIFGAGLKAGGAADMSLASVTTSAAAGTIPGPTPRQEQPQQAEALNGENSRYNAHLMHDWHWTRQFLLNGALQDVRMTLWNFGVDIDVDANVEGEGKCEGKGEEEMERERGKWVIWAKEAGEAGRVRFRANAVR